MAHLNVSSDSLSSGSASAQIAHRRWALAALSIFLLAQLLGAFLRLLPLQPFPVNYSFLMFAHSHTVLTGWAMAGLYLALLSFVPIQARGKPGYGWVFWLNQACAIGMLLSFPAFGYKGLPIVFSTLALILSYVYTWRLMRDGSLHGAELPWVSAVWAQRFLLLASLGPWATAIVRSRHIAGPWADLAVSWYLHFLVHGFFSFAVLGLLLHWLKRQGRDSESLSLRLSLLAWASLPGFAITALPGLSPAPQWVWWLAWAAAIMQSIALIGLIPTLSRAFTGLQVSSRWSKALLGVSLTAFSLKVLLQSLATVPALAPAWLVRNLNIGYLHLMFLGMLSCFLLAWLIEHGRIRKSAIGLGLFLAGFGLTEGLLFADGLSQWLHKGPLPGFQIAIFAATLLIPAGTASLLFRQLSSPKPGSQNVNVA